MAQGKKRQAMLEAKRERKRQAMLNPGNESKYAKKVRAQGAGPRMRDTYPNVWAAANRSER